MPSHAARPYRADIDGLRAVAVLLVVCDHLELHWRGGYVGVDVFFVISGYLIGASMISEFRHGTFSLASFYERRVRRIFPALLVMLSLTTVAAYCCVMPEALVQYERAVLAALLSISNFVFWRQAGYFDVVSASNLLLHTWSLAVEEQFYLIFPLFLAVLCRWHLSRLRFALWVALFFSFSLAALAVSIDPTTAFYFSPLRAWELLAGVLISQYSFSFIHRRLLREIASFAGLCLILIPGYFYTARTAFPGIGALPPCLGAVLIIASGQVGESVVGRVLSLRPVAFVGLISYSLYLWHWPILVLEKTTLFLTPNRLGLRAKLLIFCVSFVVATLSWWCVERPFRKGSWRPDRTKLYALNGALAVLLGVIAGFAIQWQGFPSRFSEPIIAVGKYITSTESTRMWQSGMCFIEPSNTFRDFNTAACLGRVPGKKQYLLYGDSLAAQLYPGLVEAFPDIHFAQATASNCTPYAEPPSLTGRYMDNCSRLSLYVKSVYLPNQHPDVVILAGDWTAKELPSLGRKILDLKRGGSQVIIFGPTIGFDTPLPYLLTAAMRRDGDDRGEMANILAQHFDGSNERLDGEMQQLARDKWNVRYISYFKDLCGKTSVTEAGELRDAMYECPAFASPGVPLLFDYHHLTVAGSHLVAGIVRSKGELSATPAKELSTGQ